MAALAIPIEVQEQSLSQSTVILQVKFGLLGDSRKVSASQVEVDTDKQLLRVAKKILVSVEFEAIRQLDRKVKKYLDSVCVPFETGTRFLAVPLIEDVDRKLREFERERTDLVDRFLDSYPTLCESMSDRLRVLHNPTDYPPIDMVKARFYFTWRYVAYGVPGQLKTISGRIWQEEREKAAQRFAEAQTEAQGLLRESMSELVNHMVERLDASENGKPKVFKKSTVANLGDFLATFPGRIKPIKVPGWELKRVQMIQVALPIAGHHHVHLCRTNQERIKVAPQDLVGGEAPEAIVERLEFLGAFRSEE